MKVALINKVNDDSNKTNDDNDGAIVSSRDPEVDKAPKVLITSTLKLPTQWKTNSQTRYNHILNKLSSIPKM